MIDPEIFLSDYHHINLSLVGNNFDNICISRKNITNMEHKLHGDTHVIHLWGEDVDYYFDLVDIVFLCRVVHWDEENECFSKKMVKTVPKKKKRVVREDIIITSTEEGS